MTRDESPTRREVAIAGHTGDLATAQAGLTAHEPATRATALGALARLGALDADGVMRAGTDGSSVVRRRAAEVAAADHGVDLTTFLDDPDPTVVEMAAWAAGEHESDRAPILDRLIELTEQADDPLVREAAVAALGAIGAERGRDAIVHALTDKPAIRRRAVLALAPFEGPDIDAAMARALEDRDWQVRQAAEDLQRAMR